MSFLKRLVPAVSVAALACTLLSPAVAAPKGFDPAQPSFVDLRLALTEYRKRQDFAKFGQRLRDKQKALGEEMRTLAQLRYSTEEERKEALAIKAKPKPTDKESARLAELMKKADTLENELASLAQKPNATESETKRIQELSGMRTEAIRTLAREEADRREQLRKLEAELMADVEVELLKIVEKVAKENKIAVVHNRGAILVGGNDLTEDVLKRLPK